MKHVSGKQGLAPARYTFDGYNSKLRANSR